MRTLLSDRFFLGAMALFTGIIVGLQLYGGAYPAEFTGHPDEAAHFVSALLVRDYIALWPPVDPMPWAVQYYIHYPKVAIGHWPPGYYVLQALWWLILPIGRASALWLNIVMGSLTMAIFYLLARRIRPGWPILITGTLLLLTPVVQEAHAMVMADLPSLLVGIIVLWLLTRLLEEPGSRRLWFLAAALAASMAVKGTGAALFAAPLLAILASGVGKRLRLDRTALIGAIVGMPVAGLYLWQYRGSWRDIRGWSGMSLDIPWYIEQVADLAGPALLVVSLAGAAITLLRLRGNRSQPAAVAAAAILFSFVIVSYYLRAIREPRHWIALIPALFLLLLVLFAWLEQRWPRLAPLALLVSLLSFPFSLYRQSPEGFQAVAAQLSLPARMLVSSSLGWSEGPWIAVVAASEARPQSTIARATKLLAETDWNIKHYKRLVQNRDEIETALDEAAADIVVLHNAIESGPEAMPHHRLLRTSLQESSSWRHCAQSGRVEAFCRTAPPRAPRKPIRIPLRSRLGYDIEER